MGTSTYPSDYKLRDCIRSSLATSPRATHGGGTGQLHLLAKCVRGNIHHHVRIWSVWQFRDIRPNGHVETMRPFIVLDRLWYDAGEKAWRSREYVEADGPIYYDCPLKYLSMAPVMRQSWRESVLDEYYRKSLRRKKRGK